MAKISELNDTASQVRRDILRMVHSAASGHPGGSLGCADYLVALFFEIMKHNPKNFTMNGIDEDVFILSNGHISPAYYSVLARSGYFDIKELGSFRKLGSRLQGHPTPDKNIPGVRIATGSLGQGLSVAIGAAMTKKLNNDDALIYSLHGDGELQEGQIWEAIMFATAKKIDNLIATIDYNGKQIDGPVNEVLPLGNLKAKFEAFGWITLEMDGNNMEDILHTFKMAKEQTSNEKPVVIIMKTEMGYGVDFMMGTHKWHGVAPDDIQLKEALCQINETIGDY
ncbi:MAG: transketolase [Bacteroidales bacterium]|nr:transketolase [Bacteroidales bacterium]